MSALSPPHLEKLLAMALDRADQLERERSAVHLRMLELETQRDVAEDERDAAIARAQSAITHVSSGLRHEAVQSAHTLRNVAHTLKATGRPKMAVDCEERADKLVAALR